jgi:transcriptional regulator with XRE-family HTH domain
MVYCYTDNKIRLVLSELRQRKKLSLQDVATRMGVTRGYIHQIESGRTSIPRYRVLIKLLEVYDIKPKYFEELMSNIEV